MPLQLTYLPLAGDVFTRVRCEGILSLRGRAPDSDPLRDLLGVRGFSHTVLMNLEKVVGAETSGISWLYMAGEHFKQAGGKLILFAVPAPVHSLLSLLEMDLPFQITSTEADARTLATSAS
jgi:anti-anti-sigma regulatory factor